MSTLYASTKDPVDIEEWVSTPAASAYALISPEGTGPNVTLPTGSIVVRAVYPLADSGAKSVVQALTVIVKGPAGTDPDVDDWWFAVTDPNGTPLLFPDGGAQVGPMTQECHSCHLARGSANDFLFGVPAADRVPSP